AGHRRARRGGPAADAPRPGAQGGAQPKAADEVPGRAEQVHGERGRA
ncbi:unnamed protein product, partial [Heterosigma akashiwo]